MIGKHDNRCVFGELGNLFHADFPRFPDYHEVKALLNELGLVGDLRPLIKKVMVASDNGETEQAWQMIEDAAAGLA